MYIVHMYVQYDAKTDRKEDLDRNKSWHCCVR